MRNVLRSVAVLLTCGMIAVGCTTLHKPTDEEMIQSTVSKVKEALEARNVDLLMTTFSENFQNPHASTKAEAKALLTQGLSMEEAKGGKVSSEFSKITINPDKKTAKVYPLDLSSNAGAVAVELVLTKEANGWMVTNVNVDGV